MDKNNTSRERGSALLVTMMITSVVLLFAMILLERIIPYSKQIRGMQDSVQAYYTAKSQIEIARSEFADTRKNIDGNSRIQDGGDGTFSLTSPVLESANPGDYLIVSEGTQLPLQMRLFENDTTVRNFGTSQKDPSFHILGSSGILFDLTERNTTNFSMITEAHPDTTTTNAGIDVEFVRNDGSTITPFFGTIATTSSLGGINIVTETSSNTPGTSLADILTTGCSGASCSLKLILTNTPGPVPIRFSLSTEIPDLNAVIVADGISPNETYHRRIIELIPLIQGI